MTMQAPIDAAPDDAGPLLLNDATLAQASVNTLDV
jgi:hypothetical protein